MGGATGRSVGLGVLGYVGDKVGYLVGEVDSSQVGIGQKNGQFSGIVCCGAINRDSRKHPCQIGREGVWVVFDDEGTEDEQRHPRP